MFTLTQLHFYLLCMHLYLLGLPSVYTFWYTCLALPLDCLFSFCVYVYLLVYLALPCLSIASLLSVYMRSESATVVCALCCVPWVQNLQSSIAYFVQ